MAAQPPQYRLLRPGRRSFFLEIWGNAGSGTIIFYPGSFLSPLQYQPLLHALRRAGLAVAALHLTGHGCNRHHILFTFNDLLNDGLEAETALHEAGFGPLIVCGHSQGGILALAHAATSQRILAAFPISGILPRGHEAIKLTIFRHFQAHGEKMRRCVTIFSKIFPQLPLPVFAYLSPGRICRNARKIQSSKQKMRHYYPLGFLASLLNARAPSRLPCPVYLFSSKDDALFTPEIVRSAFQALTAPDKRLFWLSGGGHLAALNPDICRQIATTISACCSGLGVPLRLLAALPEG